MQKFAVIVAGGSGSRMQSDVPKQFLNLAGKPVLFHTIEAFQDSYADLYIKLVIPSNQFDMWASLSKQFNFDFSGELIAGGPTRFHSVQNGLLAITAEQGLVAVHDGVRPLINKSTIHKAFDKANDAGTAVVSVPLKDSIREVKPDGTNFSAFREAFRMIQTPQIFRLDWMRNAFQTDWLPEFTDCASVLEHAGYPIHLVDGDYTNIKITTPEDLFLAEAFLNA